MSDTFAFIAAHTCDHSISLMCRARHVSRSWFHAWHRTAPDRAARVARHEALIDEIREIFEERKQRSGAPRIHAELRGRDPCFPKDGFQAPSRRSCCASVCRARDEATWSSPTTAQAAHADDHRQQALLRHRAEPVGS